MPIDENFDFRELVERYSRDDRVQKLTITVFSGDKYEVGARDQLTFYKYVVVFIKEDEVESIFPFEVICNVDVQFKSEEE